MTDDGVLFLAGTACQYRINPALPKFYGYESRQLLNTYLFLVNLHRGLPVLLGLVCFL
jgi:hypothetical protein